MTSLVTFPTAKTMFPLDGKKITKMALIRSRYYLRYVLSAKYCHHFVDFLNHHSVWQQLFTENPYRFNTMLYRFCDKRFNPQQRLTALRYNFEFAEKAFSHSLCQNLVTQNSVAITPLNNGISAYLNINTIDPVEGFFSVNLRDENNNRLYDLSFSFIPDNQLLITSIQGPNGEEAQDLVRMLTKQLHGIRPSYMLIMLMKIISRQLGCHLIGIKHKNQAKYRWNDHSRLLFNYDQFWQENGAEFNHLSQYWRLSTEIERREPESIQSKKRSMYRKRYEMLDQVQSAVERLLPHFG